MHCLVPKWNKGDGNEKLLENALTSALLISSPSSIVIPPCSIHPINYPSKAVAEALIKSLQNIRSRIEASELKIAVYTKCIDEAKTMKKVFLMKNLKVRSKDIAKHLYQQDWHADSSTSISVRAIDSNLPSLIFVAQGDILKQKVCKHTTLYIFHYL